MPQDPRVFGHIPGVRIGDTFQSRDELLKAGVHGQTQAGIHGDSREGWGAFSICISQGYEDNKDNGDKIIYVGSGGQNANGEQIADQSFDDPPNKSLQISCQTKRPVRVIRGKSKTNFYAPKNGYRYDGLYVVDSAEMRAGKRNHQMCFFELRRIREEGDGPIPHRRLLDSKKLLNINRQARHK